MKLVGFLLLVAGFAIVFSAFTLLAAVRAQSIFVLAGTVVELIGLGMVFRAQHLAPPAEER
ncbi:MAG TPA: hypothetical protein VMT82_00315 [candidate division Zixibacteria bacterium]|nr:hypothetical protein [candidate division Zixibacteria bacterium]